MDQLYDSQKNEDDGTMGQKIPNTLYNIDIQIYQM